MSEGDVFKSQFPVNYCFSFRPRSPEGVLPGTLILDLRKARYPLTFASEVHLPIQLYGDEFLYDVSQVPELGVRAKARRELSVNLDSLMAHIQNNGIGKFIAAADRCPGEIQRIKFPLKGRYLFVVEGFGTEDYRGRTGGGRLQGQKRGKKL